MTAFGEANTMKKLLLLVAALGGFSCEKSPAPAANTHAKQPARAKPAAAPAIDPAALFTEEKIRGFVVYERETAGLGRATSNPAAWNAALAKSGLTKAEVAELERILSFYISTRWTAAMHADTKRRMGAKHSSAKKRLAELQRLFAAEADEAKARLEQQYGRAAMAIVAAHENELVEYYRPGFMRDLIK
jgi:hypothetical protein